MRCLGILSVREDTGEKYKGRIRILEKERFCREISVVVAEFSISREELQRKKPWQKRRLFQKGENFLVRLGADAVVPTISCSGVFEIPVAGNMTVETTIETHEMTEALKAALLDYRESPVGKTGWVSDKKCSPVCLPLLVAMSQKVQYLGIATGEREKAEEWEEVLCREYGVNLEIQPVYPWKERENTILADVDAGRILFAGKEVLGGKKMTLDLQGYQVDLPQLLRQHPEFWEVLSPIGWCRGKSG